MQKVIYLGYVVAPEDVDDYAGISIAGNKMQWNVLQYLAELNLFDIDCLTISPLAAFPKQKKLFQRKEQGMLFEKVQQTKVPYCNFPILKQISQVRAVYKAAYKLLKKHPDAILLGFNLFPQIGIPLCRLKKRFPRCKTVSLLADLPIDDNTTRKGFSKYLRKKFDESTWKSISSCESFIVLNEYVGKQYLQGKPFIVVDGGVCVDEIRSYQCIPKEKKNIMFCGALTEYNGIVPLLKAMEYLTDTDITLDIYGGGYLEKTVGEYVSSHSNVFYHGKITNKEVMQKQREAWLLINPRNVDDLIAKVTFPSKTFEYMLSGTPILSTRLNGYSEEYQDKMFFIDDASPEGIALKVLEIAQKDNVELIAMAKKAYNFVVEKRTWKKQVEKITNLLLLGDMNAECK